VSPPHCWWEGQIEQVFTSSLVCSAGVLTSNGRIVLGYMGNNRIGYGDFKAEGITISIELPFIASMVVWSGLGKRWESKITGVLMQVGDCDE
jgi:hypothetical protein